MDKAKINKNLSVTWQSKHCTAQVTFGTVLSEDWLITAQKWVKVTRGSSGTPSETTGSGVETEVRPQNYFYSHPPPHKAESGGKVCSVRTDPGAGVVREARASFEN